MPVEPTPKRFRLLVTLLVITCLAISPFVWYYWLTAVYVDAVPPDERVREDYFGLSPEGLFPGLTKKDIVARNIVQATGRFQGSGPFLRATLYVVEGGKVTKGSSLSAGESSCRLGTFFGEHLRIVFALSDIKTSVGLFTDIGCVGETSAGGATIPVLRRVQPKFQKALPGWVPRLYERLVYVEGEQQINATASMALEEFANANHGNYLVVTMQMK